jgi:lipoyl(octanoyl) transferase
MSDRRSLISEHASRSLEVHLLGLVDFDSARGLQERLAFEIGGQSAADGTLLLCEHPPQITLGRDARSSHVLAEAETLANREIGVEWVARGGPAVCHAPGQLAIYPILPLDRLKIGISEFRNRLESAIVDVCHELRVAAKRRPGEPGVWTRYGQVAMFGSAVKSWVTTHGMFLNVTIDPGYLKLVDSTPGERATSLQALRLGPVGMNQVREAVIRHIATQFEFSNVQTSAGHPLLRRTIRRICLNA